MKSPSTYTAKCTVRGYELDSYGHVNHAVYLNYFEHGRWELFRESGLLAFIKDHQLLLVVIDTHVRYLREAKLFDELLIETHIRMDRNYLIFKQKLINCSSSLTIARGETKAIFLDKTTRKPVDIPVQIAQQVTLKDPR